jgi:hypothetical protein
MTELHPRKICVPTLYGNDANIGSWGNSTDTEDAISHIGQKRLERMALSSRFFMVLFWRMFFPST